MDNTVDYKRCIDDTIYYYSPVKSHWAMARFYCQSIFNGYQNADLLFITNEKEKKSFTTFAKGLRSISASDNSE